MISLVDLIDHVFAIKTCQSWSRILDKLISKLCTRSAPFDIILLSNMVIVHDLKQVKPNKSRFHSKKDHDFWIQRNGFCPYCNSGSAPVKKSEIIGDLK